MENGGEKLSISEATPCSLSSLFGKSRMQSTSLQPGDIRALCIFGGYLSTCTLLTALIIGDLCKQYRTWENQQKTKGHFRRPGTRTVRIFGACATICLSITWYYMISFFALSYQVWAVQNVVNVPETPWHLGEVAPWVRSLQLGSWLKDVQLFRDAWEVAMETPGRLFWSQPIFFVTTAWSFYIGYQGKTMVMFGMYSSNVLAARILHIRHAWAYMLLGQIVAISFAQSLFFVAIVLYSQGGAGFTPAGHSKASNDAEHVKGFSNFSWRLMVFALAFIPVLFISASIHTPRFLAVLAIPHLALLLPPILDPLEIGGKLGRRSITLHQREVKRLNGILLFGACLWQLRIATFALKDTLPGKHIHRHSEVYSHPMLDGTDSDSFLTNSGLTGLVGSLYDHPAVSSVGWDTLLCSLNYLIWRVVVY